MTSEVETTALKTDIQDFFLNHHNGLFLITQTGIIKIGEIQHQNINDR